MPPPPDYEKVAAEVKTQAGIFFTYIALVRVAPIVLDAVFGE